MTLESASTRWIKSSVLTLDPQALVVSVFAFLAVPLQYFIGRAQQPLSLCDIVAQGLLAFFDLASVPVSALLTRL